MHTRVPIARTRRGYKRPSLKVPGPENVGRSAREGELRGGSRKITEGQEETISRWSRQICQLQDDSESSPPVVLSFRDATDAERKKTRLQREGREGGGESEPRLSVPE